MRVSVWEHDPGFEKFMELGGFSAGIRVFLNDREVQAYTADDEAGIVVVPDMEATRRAIAAGGEEYIHKTLSGKVRIEYGDKR